MYYKICPYERPNQMEKTFLLGHMKTMKGCASIPNSADNRVILLFTDVSGNIEDNLGKKLIKRWEKVKTEFRSWWRGQLDFKLGKILPITVQTDTTILALLVFKDGVMDLAALKDAMILAGRFVAGNKYNLHVNKTDSNWEQIELMLTEYFVKSGVNVTVYEK